MIDKKPYPLAASIAMIVGAIVLAFVDLAFLNEVIGKVLDIDITTSMVVAFAIGMVGIAIMASQGIRLAHGHNGMIGSIIHYSLWLLLGLALVLIRIFSATVMGLDLSLGDESTINILGQDIRQVDLIIAPLMLLLYIATGLMVKDGVQHLFLNPDLAKWLADRKKNKETRKTQQSKREAEAAAKMQKLQDQQSKLIVDRQERIENERIQSALNGSYSNALAQFRAKEAEIKGKYQQIAANINYVQSIDKQEREFEKKIKPGLMKIINESVRSLQNTVALAVRKKTGEDITTLRNAIQSHNNRHE